MSVETSLESIISDLSFDYFKYSDDVMRYAALRGLSLDAPDLTFPTEEETPTVNTEVAYKKNGDRLFTPDSITGGFPVYQAPPEIDWSALYAAIATHTDRVWISSEMDTLIAKMQELILGDEAWLRGDYQQFVIDTDRDRRLQTLDDSLRMVASTYAGRSFKIPTSALYARENEIILKYQFDNTNSSRELGKSVMEAAKNFQQYAMGQGMTYEQLNMGFTQAYNLALIEPIKLKVSVYKQQLETAAEVFGNKVKEIVLKFEAEKTSWDVTNTYNETVFKSEAFPWEMYKIQVSAAATKAREEVDMFKTKVNADVAALVAGTNSMANLAQTGAVITINKK